MAGRAVAFAYHDVGARCLGVLLELGVCVPLVVTHRDDPGEHVWFASVMRLAQRRGIETISPDDPNAAEAVARVRSIAPDFLFSFYYRTMLSRRLLDCARRGAYNMHGSLLPKYRGRAPINWAVLNGETETGATLHEMTEKPDAGPIVDQARVPIGPDDLALDVLRKVTDAAETIMRRSLPRLVAGTAVLRPQDLSRGSYFGRRTPEDGRIDWNRGTNEIHNLVRAVAPPYPGAFTDLRQGRLLIHRTRRLGRAVSAPVPSLVAAPAALRVTAVCADGEALELVELVFEGAPLSAEGFVSRFGVDPIALPRA